LSWVQDLLDATDKAESPKQYIYWSALTAISAVMRKNVWINKGGLYKLYPNIYVFLIGRSGLRKGFPVSIAKNLVEQADVIRVISGRVSIQGVIKELSVAKTSETGKIHTYAQAFLASGEYASFIIDDPAAVYCLTDLYDTNAHENGWVNTLAMEQRRLINPYLVVLGASNETNLSETLPKSANGGGFVARTFFVQADSLSKVNDLMEPAEMLDLSPFSKYLVEISKLAGEILITEKAKKLYSPWYLALQDELRSKEDPTGTLQRIHDQVLKVAMLISLAESTNLIVEEKHMEESMEVCQECVPGMRKVMLKGGTNALSQQISDVIRLLLKHEEISRKLLLRKGWPHFDAFDLDRITETLTQAGIVKVHKSKEGLMYKLEKEAAAEFLGGEKWKT